MNCMKINIKRKIDWSVGQHDQYIYTLDLFIVLHPQAIYQILASNLETIRLVRQLPADILLLQLNDSLIFNGKTK